MKKKKNASNLIFSAFLVTAYVVCSYFFIGIIRNSTKMNATLQSLLCALVFVIFGLILFYATRVGDGKQVKRFSLSALILLDLPALYIILASAAQGLPMPFDISTVPEVAYFAAVALGYGIPYTFLSGYELDPDEGTANADDTNDTKKEAAAEEEEEKPLLDDVTDDIGDTEDIDDIQDTESTEEAEEAAESEPQDDTDDNE